MHVWILLLCASAAALAQDDFIYFQKNEFYTCSDTYSLYDTAVLQRVAQNLAMERVPNLENGPGVTFNNQSVDWRLSYSEHKIPRIGIDSRLSTLSYKCIFEDSIILCKFRVEVPPLMTNDTIAFQFLLSAYQQELSAGLGREEKKFATLPAKSPASLFARTWIFPALGIRYLRENDPFSLVKSRNIVTYFWIDAIGWSCVLLSPFSPAQPQNKVYCAYAGLAILASARIAVTGELRRGLRQYDLIRGSPYRIPAAIVPSLITPR